MIPTQPYIEKAMAMNAFPNICKVKYQLISNFVILDDDSDAVIAAKIKAQVDLVENAVLSLYSKGVKYVIFGGRSTYMGPWTSGDAVLTNLGGLNEQQRFPASDMFFGYNNLGATQTYIDLLLTNATSQTDRSTPDQPIAEAAITTYTNGGLGQVLFVYQAADAVSIDSKDLYQAAALALGVTFTAQAITFPFAADIAALAPTINALGVNDVVMFAVNGQTLFQDDLVNALNAAALTTPARLFGPVNVNLNYDLFYNAGASFPYFSPFLISLGYSNSPTFTTSSLYSFIESMGYFNAMACLKPWAGTDGTARYNIFKDFINPLIANQVIRANTGPTAIITLNATVNPVWDATNNTTVAFPV